MWASARQELSVIQMNLMEQIQAVKSTISGYVLTEMSLAISLCRLQQPHLVQTDR